MKEKHPLSKSFKRRFRWLFWGIFSTIWIFVIIYFILIANGKLGLMPSFEQLENPKSDLATQIITADQQLMGTYFKENRTQTEYDSISPFVFDALIATEDVRFEKHSGIDFKALGRVGYGVITRNLKGGGSTVSQQLSKLIFPREDFSNSIDIANRKFREWVIAVKLEKSYTKEEILTMYLNRFDFLNLAVGIESAARVYFSTTPDSLNIQQSAMLVGMLQNPSMYNPRRFPEKTKHRRNVVLSQMMKYQYITKAEFDSVKNLPLGIRFSKVDHNIGQGTYFREFLRQWLTASKPVRSNYRYKPQQYIEDSISWEIDPTYGWCNKNIKPDGTNYNIYRDGLKIYTTIDSRMQSYAEDAVKQHIGGFLQPQFYKDRKGRRNAPFDSDLSKKDVENILKATKRRSERYRQHRASGMSADSIDIMFNTPTKMSVFSWKGDIDTVMTPMDSIKYYKFFLHAGFISIEPQTGYVKAYIGDINYKHFKYDMASLGRRQVGSTFKPFIYTLAMQNGISPCHKVPNIPVSFKMPPEQEPEFYTPKYSKNKHEGEMVSLKMGLAGSWNQISAWVLKQFSPEAVVDVARSMGVISHIDPYPSICVGAAEVTLKEMVGAYTTFANQGIYSRPLFVTRIEDKNGNILSEFQSIQNEAIDEQTAFLMIDLMRGVVDFGTSYRLRYNYKFTAELAAKTGTTNNHSDGWFMGIAPNLVSGAWVGGEERSIHFRGIRLGQGASMALPIWALYMEKVYADPNLPYTQEDKFTIPDNLDVIIDCEEWENQNGEDDYMDI